MNESQPYSLDSLAQAHGVADYSLEHAATHGWQVTLEDATPIVPDEHFPDLTWRGTWSGIGELLDLLNQFGAHWVNLRFALADDGSLMIRYESRPGAVPLDKPRMTGVTGGFDCERHLTDAEIEQHKLGR